MAIRPLSTASETVLVKTYCNRWIPTSVLDILASESGPILDVGGGAAPFCRASHVIDSLPFDKDRLTTNAWGGARTSPWQHDAYTQVDICGRERWPFPDKVFALGLCSHTLEDLRDPLPALAELGRVCDRLLIITPSRLLEQTQNIDHPRFCGFAHHVWIVFADQDGLVFRRKTAYINFPGCHLICPAGSTLSVDAGTFVYYGRPVKGREMVFWSASEELADYRQFIQSVKVPTSRQFVPDARQMNVSRRLYYLKQKFLYSP